MPRPDERPAPERDEADRDEADRDDVDRDADDVACPFDRRAAPC